MFSIQIMKQSHFLTIIVCGLILTGCCTSRHAARWEYRMAHDMKEVNELADQGWVVVNFAPQPEGGPINYLLRRAK